MCEDKIDTLSRKFYRKMDKQNEKIEKILNLLIEKKDNTS